MLNEAVWTVGDITAGLVNENNKLLLS